MEVAIDTDKFFSRLGRLYDNWNEHKNTSWGGAEALCIPFGATGNDLNYSKSAAFHIYFLGYEFPETLILITRNNVYFMATPKKCSYFEKDLVGKHPTINVHVLKRGKEDALNREIFNSLVNIIRKGGNKKLGSIFKGEYLGAFVPSWLECVEQNQLEKVEISNCLGLFLAVKDASELELCKRAAILSNKVMKHGFVQEMETIIDSDLKIKHDDLAAKVDAIILDPSSIGVKVAADYVDSCYQPIIQSGGKYDIKVSATSDSNILSSDIIICSLGARYRGYCANISRTFMVDAPQRVEVVYGILLALFNACLESMIPGNELKDVCDAAKNFLKERDPSLLSYLPKTLGFGIGIEFRDSSLVLNATNNTKFTAGMLFNLAVGFHNIPLSAEEKAQAPESVQKLEVYSMLLADVVVVQEGLPEVLTKLSKEYSDVSYSITGEDNEEQANQEGENGQDNQQGGVRRSNRARDEKEANEEAAMNRQQRQKLLMERKLQEARNRMRLVGTAGLEDAADLTEAKDLRTYRSAAEYPKDMNPYKLKVDMEKEAILVPINGHVVPFHISTIKNMTQPDPDLRINFYIPGAALGKEVAKNTQYLIIKYGAKAVFVKELTFRASDSSNLSDVYRNFTELRKKVRQRELKAEQEKDLVVQTKLIRIKDQRVPRLQEVVMRPQISGRKCVGTIEAHQNGLRFTSTKAEIADIMYANIKHAIFQPCHKTATVLVHFHLKDFIIIGKKKQKDVQFYAEVVENSLNIDGMRRSNYDPDELDEEQREREMRKKLNLAFKEFCSKVEKVAAHYDFKLKMEVPSRDLGFLGTWSKDMVPLYPTTNCLVNLSEWPPFVLTMAEVEHVHFERVTFATKSFDIAFIFKNWDIPPKIVSSVDVKYMDLIQDWLIDQELTYSKGPKSMNWTDVFKVLQTEKATFYDDKDPDGTPKPAGWLFLSAEDSDDEEEEENEDSSFSSAGEDEDEDDSDNSSDDDDSGFSEEDEDDDDEEEEDEDELEEKGKSWEELEQDAKIADQKRAAAEPVDDLQAKKKKKSFR